MAAVITNTMRIYSDMFDDDYYIPEDYTCDSTEKSPELVIEDIPLDALSLVLIMDDITSVTEGGIKNHWILWNISAGQKKILIEEDLIPEGSVVGRNDFNSNSYVGPCPHIVVHKYRFTVYAINRFLDIDENKSKKDVLEWIENDILASASIDCYYKRLDIVEEKDYNYIDKDDRDEDEY